MRGKAALIIMACALAAGCGKRGSLERPPPLWGEAPAEAPQADGPDAPEAAPGAPKEDDG